MWHKSILVNAQISRTLVDHLADDVYFHLQKAGNQTGSLLLIDRRFLTLREMFLQSFQILWKAYR